MIGLLPGPIHETERVKDLQTATLKSIGLAAKDLCVSLVDNASVDAAMRHPGGCHQPAAAFTLVSPLGTKGLEKRKRHVTLLDLPRRAGTDDEPVKIDVSEMLLMLMGDTCGEEIVSEDAYTSTFDSGVAMFSWLDPARPLQT